MGMYSYVKGLKPKTEEYEKKLRIYKDCKELNINPPKEIEDYFDGEVCEEGIVIDLPKDAISESVNVDYCNEYFDVDLTKIPSDVTIIRFVNSY